MVTLDQIVNTHLYSISKDARQPLTAKSTIYYHLEVHDPISLDYIVAHCQFSSISILLC